MVFVFLVHRIRYKVSFLCVGFSAAEVKEHTFFSGTDWQLVYLQKYPPPIIPPRGEVNAADAFDIGSFDEEDTKGIKVICVLSLHLILLNQFSFVYMYVSTFTHLRWQIF